MGEMTSMQRTIAAISHVEADRVPLFLLFGYRAAKEMRLSIKDYYADPANIVEAQLRLQKKYRTDCLFAFYYASLELEAMGGTSLFFHDGPPNAGSPIIKRVEDIPKLIQFAPPSQNPVLQNVLKAISMMKREVEDSIPIIAVAISPFSMPVMQLGFERYLNVLIGDHPFFERLMDVNEAFCVDWANAQIAAGATAICYFDPVSSPSIIPVDMYRQTGFVVAKRTLGKVKGAVATHLASGRSLSIVDSLVETGASVVGISSDEDIRDAKDKCRGKIAVLGNLNGVEMCRWDRGIARHKTMEAIRKGAPGGGFILADNHGEIPWNVRDEVLEEISNTVMEHGRYPVIA